MHDELTEKLGTFPLFHFWGPGPDIVSSQWIADATRHVMRTRRPDLTLCYPPHLHYGLQRFGPDDPRSHRATGELDAAIGPLLDERPCPRLRRPLDASPVRGSHGRLPTSDEEGPLVLVSTPRAVSGRAAATEVKSLLLRLAGLSRGGSRRAPAVLRQRKREPL